MDIYNNLHLLYYAFVCIKGVMMDENVTEDVIQSLVVAGLSYNEVLAILPCIVLGLLVGVANYFKPYMEGNSTVIAPSIGRFFGSATSSAVISFVVFALLDSTDFSFLTKLAISSAVAFLGIDKAIEVAQKILSLRKQ